MILPDVNSERWMSPESFEGEIWLRTLPELKHGIYYVSNYGRIMRIRQQKEAQYKKILKQYFGRANHLRIKQGKQFYQVHRLVALAFLENQNNLPEVDHINGNPQDNTLMNLRWVDHKTNANNPISRLRIKLFKETNILRFVPPEKENRPRMVSEAAFGDSHGIRLSEIVNLLKYSIDYLDLSHLESVSPAESATNNYKVFQKSKIFVPPGEHLYYLCGGEVNPCLMTFAFYLKDKHKKEGTPLIIIISHRGKKFKKSTGIIVKPAFFKKQRVYDEEINKKLRLIENILNEKLNQFSTSDEITKTLDYAVYLATGKRGMVSNEKDEIEDTTLPSFYGYFEEWANRDTPQKRQRRNTLKLIRECMGDRYDWDGVDTAFYFRLVQLLKDKNYSINYIGSVIKKLKTVMSEGYKLKYHNNQDYHQFSSPMEQPDTIYLTKAEVDRLWNLELTDPLLSQVRDLFILGCQTAMRYSDYSRLSMDNIRKGMIYFTQHKTAGSVVIPASPRVLTILRRNGGAAPKMTQEVFNRKIKVVCMMAKINDRVEVTRSKGHRHETELVEKWKLCSSHTARRTGATLLYQAGVPASSCMQITGHKTESAFYRYIRTTKEENARALAKNPFFTQN